MADSNAALSRMEERIDKQIAHHRRARNITLGIGAALIVVLIAYFSFLTSLVRNLMTPESVSEIAVDYAERSLPELRQEITTALRDNADEYLDTAVDQLVAFVPEGRAFTERWARENFDLYLRELDVTINELADYAIDAHGDQVREMLDLLDDDINMPALEEELFTLLMDPVYQSNAHVDLRAYGIALSDLATRLERLVEGENLSESERIERDIVIALKQISIRSEAIPYE